MINNKIKTYFNKIQKNKTNCLLFYQDVYREQANRLKSIILYNSLVKIKNIQ